MAQVFVTTTQPSNLSPGDFWINPATRAVKVVSSIDPKVVFSDVFAGDAKAPVADVATANADATYGQPEADLINEIKAQLNLVLARLRSIGLIQS